MKIWALPAIWVRETKNETSVALDRIAKVNFLTRGPILFFLMTHILAIVLFESEHATNNAGYLAMAFILSELAYFTLYLALLPAASSLQNLKIRSAANIVIISAAVGARATVLEALHFNQGLASELNWSRVTGDVTAGLMTIVLVGYITNSARDLKRARVLLEKNQAVLELHKENLPNTTRAVGIELMNRAQAALFGQLAALRSLALGSPRKNKVALLAKQLQTLIEKDIRPLSRELLERVDVLSKPTSQDEFKVRTRWGDLKINPARDLRLWLSFWLVALNIFVTAAGNNGLALGLVVLALSAIFPMTFSTLLNLKALKKNLSPIWAFVLLMVVGAVSWLPILVLLEISGLEVANQNQLQRGVFGLLMFVNMVIAFWNAEENFRTSITAEAENLKYQIEKELTLAEQEIWLAKRNWSYLIHGSVLGAITVAHSRLQAASPGSEPDFELVAKDVQKAIDSLTSGNSMHKPLDESVVEIMETWSGVCDLSIPISPEIRGKFLGQERASACLTEILRELVGNAVRHGGATKLDVTFGLAEDQLLVIDASNNGRPYEKNPGGLGFTLFDELTTTWSVSQNGDQSVFQALMPISRSREDRQAKI